MKFCFFGDISGALKGQTPGGAELQIALLARALALNGHEVVIVDPYSTESFVTGEGVKLINIPGWNKGVRGIRLFFYRIPVLRKTFLEQNADYYYVRMRSYLHLIPYRAARRIGSKFIVAIAHDIDVLSLWGKFRYKYKRSFNLFKFLTLHLPSDLVFNYLLKKADYITIQHSGQKLSSNSVKGKIVLFSNIFESANIPIVKSPSKNYFISVGDMSIIKGVENLYQLIKMVDKKNSITIVGQPIDNRSKEIYKRLNEMENVVLKGRLNHGETIQLIANARALINTSDFEGFPNIFLEAWATGIPVISLKVNPGNVFNNYDLGLCCEGDLNNMKKCIELDETTNIDREGLISYVSVFHDFANAGDRFLKGINIV